MTNINSEMYIKKNNKIRSLHNNCSEGIHTLFYCNVFTLQSKVVILVEKWQKIADRNG